MGSALYRLVLPLPTIPPTLKSAVALTLVRRDDSHLWLTAMYLIQIQIPSSVLHLLATASGGWGGGGRGEYGSPNYVLLSLTTAD